MIGYIGYFESAEFSACCLNVRLLSLTKYAENDLITEEQKPS